MIGIIIQARMSSTRLQGKVLKIIGNKTLLGHILFRLQYLKTEADVVVATSTERVNDAIFDFCLANNTKCFRGSEENVVNRFYECAKLYSYSHIVRLTADNPFTDIEELDKLIGNHILTKADYSKSVTVLPHGIGAEVFTMDSLEKSNKNTDKIIHLEYVDEYITNNPTKFTINSFTDIRKSKQRPDIRLTVDTADDYKKACFIVENCSDEFITTEEAIRLCLEFDNLS